MVSHHLVQADATKEARRLVVKAALGINLLLFYGEKAERRERYVVM